MPSRGTAAEPGPASEGSPPPNQDPSPAVDAADPPKMRHKSVESLPAVDAAGAGQEQPAGGSGEAVRGGERSADEHAPAAAARGQGADGALAPPAADTPLEGSKGSGEAGNHGTAGQQPPVPCGSPAPAIEASGSTSENERSDAPQLRPKRGFLFAGTEGAGVAEAGADVAKSPGPGSPARDQLAGRAADGEAADGEASGTPMGAGAADAAGADADRRQQDSGGPADASTTSNSLRLPEPEAADEPPALAPEDAAAPEDAGRQSAEAEIAVSRGLSTRGSLPSVEEGRNEDAGGAPEAAAQAGAEGRGSGGEAGRGPPRAAGEGTTQAEAAQDGGYSTGGFESEEECAAEGGAAGEAAVQEDGYSTGGFESDDRGAAEGGAAAAEGGGYSTGGFEEEAVEEAAGEVGEAAAQDGNYSTGGFEEEGEGGSSTAPPPSPPSRTNWTRLVPPSVLTGHASSLLPY
jgi:hypothetical protein